MSRRVAGLSSGQRDHVITLQQRPAADAATPTGFPKDGAWTTLQAGMPAAKDDLVGDEQYRTIQASASADKRWEINYRTDMDPDLIDVPKLRRVIYQGRIHDIKVAKVIGRRRGIELFTKNSMKEAS